MTTIGAVCYLDVTELEADCEIAVTKWEARQKEAFFTQKPPVRQRVGGAKGCGIAGSGPERIHGISVTQLPKTKSRTSGLRYPAADLSWNEYSTAPPHHFMNGEDWSSRNEHRLSAGPALCARVQLRCID